MQGKYVHIPFYKGEIVLSCCFLSAFSESLSSALVHSLENRKRAVSCKPKLLSLSWLKITMQWSTYWHPTKYVGLRSAKRKKILRYIISFQYWWYFSTDENARQHFQADVLSSSFSLRLGTMSVYLTGERTLERTIQHSMNRLKKYKAARIGIATYSEMHCTIFETTWSNSPAPISQRRARRIPRRRAWICFLFGFNNPMRSLTGVSKCTK